MRSSLRSISSSPSRDSVSMAAAKTRPWRSCDLKPWDERKGADHTVQKVIARSFAALSPIKDAIIFPINPPAIPELGTSSGFDFQLQDLSGLGHDKLVAARNQLLALAAKNPHVTQVRLQGLEDTAQLKIDIDENKATTLGVAPADINSALQASFGSAYINNFVHGNRVQRVIMQLDAPFRMAPDDISQVFVRNSAGTMVPLAAFVRTEWNFGAPLLQRYNGFPSMEIIGAAPPGKSTGEAMLAMEEMARELPAGIGFEWTGQSYEERLSGAQAPMLYAHLADRGLPLPRGAVRKLVDSTRGYSRRAARHRWRAAGDDAARNAERCLLQGRPARHGRSLNEERDPDHRVRRRADGARQGTDRSDARSGAASAASDPDDVVRLHSRRDARSQSAGAPARRAKTQSARASSAA